MIPDDNNFFSVIDPDANYFDLSSYQSAPVNSNYISVSDFKELMDSSSGFTCLNYNIRSFNKNFDTFFCLFEQRKQFPDVLVLTETWFDVDSFRNIPGYQGFHAVREGVRSGSNYGKRRCT